MIYGGGSTLNDMVDTRCEKYMYYKMMYEKSCIVLKSYEKAET